jgi:hypothetical protein
VIAASAIYIARREAKVAAVLSDTERPAGRAAGESVRARP